MVVAPPPISLSVVVPAYNEEGRLAATIETVERYLRQQPWDWEVRVIDDGSTDGTAAIADRCARDEPRVIVQRERHRGKGGAVRAGLLAARGSHRFMCDADLAMPIEQIARFLPPVLTSSYDLAIGTREGLKARRVGEPAYRHVMGRLFNRLVQSQALPGIEDSQCGFKMFTAEAVQQIFPRTTVDGWAFDVEVLTIATGLGLRVVEVPIDWHYGAASKVRMLSDGVRMLREVRHIRRRARAGEYR